MDYVGGLGLNAPGIFSAKMNHNLIYNTKEMKSEVVRLWASDDHEFPIYEASRALDRRSNLPGLSKVRYCFEVDRATFVVVSPDIRDDDDSEVRVRVPLKEVTIEDIIRVIPREPTKKVLDLQNILRSDIIAEPWIVKEGKYRVRAGVGLPGLQRVKITTMIGVSDTVDLPPAELPRAAEYLRLLQNTAPPELWAKFKPWSGYASEMLIKAFLQNAYKLNPFEAILNDPNPSYGNIFTCRQTAKNIKRRWNEMIVGIHLLPTEFAEAPRNSSRRAISARYKMLFNFLVKVSRKFEHDVADSAFERNEAHWGYYLTRLDDFYRLAYGSGFPVSFTNQLTYFRDIALNPNPPENIEPEGSESERTESE